jgi:hypothetical protein
LAVACATRFVPFHRPKSSEATFVAVAVTTTVRPVTLAFAFTLTAAGGGGVVVVVVVVWTVPTVNLPFIDAGWASQL